MADWGIGRSIGRRLLRRSERPVRLIGASPHRLWRDDSSLGERQVQERVHDCLSREGVAIEFHSLAHGGESGGIAQELVDFIRQRGELVALDRQALFEQVIGVALFLAGDG